MDEIIMLRKLVNIKRIVNFDLEVTIRTQNTIKALYEEVKQIINK